jgi:hypothetical protein
MLPLLGGILFLLVWLMISARDGEDWAVVSKNFVQGVIFL